MTVSKGSDIAVMKSMKRAEKALGAIDLTTEQLHAVMNVILDVVTVAVEVTGAELIAAVNAELRARGAS